MNFKLNRLPFFAAVAVLIVLATTAQALPITFQVRMARQIELGNFDPATDTVDLAGTFNGWGFDPLTVLSDADGDTIYEVTLNGFNASDYIEYKFRLNGLWDGSEEFPNNGANRPYVVQPDSNVILVWYGDILSATGVGPTHWWNDTVFYELFVRSFQDSDGDGIGDFQGLIQRLDYLADLGVTGLWLMPINDSPSYHGYDTTDYRAINPDYGTMADFQAFLTAAHARGIKVIIDYVMNHCSNQHPWFVAAAQNDPIYRDYFRWSPTDPGETGPWGQDLWHQNSSGWYYGLFWGGMPDLNYDTPALKTEMLDTAAWWLDTIGVDGFRLDAVLYIDEDPGQFQNTPGTLQFWHDFNTAVKAANPDAMSVGEAWTASSIVREYVTDDRLDICFEFDLSYAMMGAVNYGYADDLRRKAAEVYGLYPYLQFGTFLTNHDQDRSFTALGEDEGKARAAAGIYLTLPGVPFVYYGEEVGLVGSGPDEYKRSPMQWTAGAGAGFTTGTPWQPVNSNHIEYNVQDEQSDPTSLFSWYQKLIAVRNQTPVLRRGIYEPVTSSDGAVMAFVRRDSAQTVLCLANTAAGPVSSLMVTGSALSLTPGDYTLTNLLDPADTFTATVTLSHEITGLNLNGYQTAVYEFSSASAVALGNEDLPTTAPRLAQNVPNPFNPATTIRYRVQTAGSVSLKIYDLDGALVRTLVNAHRDAGSHQARWLGRNDQGQSVATGAYLYELTTPAGTERRKMLLVR